jgi:hypothetical protein
MNWTSHGVGTRTREHAFHIGLCTSDELSVENVRAHSVTAREDTHAHY